MLLNKKNRTWVEVSKKNLLHNLNSFRKLVGKRTKITGVVKANAYGHGLAEVASIIKNKVDFLAVDNVTEALTLRKLGIKQPILILGYILLENINSVIENDISFVVYSQDTVKKNCFVKVEE